MMTESRQLIMELDENARLWKWFKGGLHRSPLFEIELIHDAMSSSSFKYQDIGHIAKILVMNGHYPNHEAALSKLNTWTN